MKFATIICHKLCIEWEVSGAQKFRGSDPIGNQDYMVVLSNVINRLQQQHGFLEFDFING